jgi:uncharacterized protein YecE (DUF72 family)
LAREALDLTVVSSGARFVGTRAGNARRVLLVGTSGWQYRHWRARVYPKGVPAARWLEYYAERFSTVEVNNTFYRLPNESTFAAWAERVPDDFVIAVKASRFLTHYKRLQEPEEAVERLVRHATRLDQHLGPILLQLPPDLRAEPERLDETLRAFGRRVRVAVEPRHPSWFCDDVRSVLEARGAALCLADRGSRPVTPIWRTTDWAYVRFHEGTARPRPSYGRQALTSWTSRLVELWGDELDGYAYFNNDSGGCAVRDAVTFAVMMRRSGVSVGRVPELGGSSSGRRSPFMPAARA